MRRTTLILEPFKEGDYLRLLRSRQSRERAVALIARTGIGSLSRSRWARSRATSPRSSRPTRRCSTAHRVRAAAGRERRASGWQFSPGVRRLANRG
jgi:hypothetical protein